MSKIRGFSLLEALIAGFIIFIVLATLAQVFSGAMLSSERASKVASLSYSVPIIVENISVSIRDENQRSGNGTWDQVNYRWTAQPIETKPVWSAELTLDQGAGNAAEVTLLEVSVIVTFKGNQREFTFEEVVW